MKAGTFTLSAPRRRNQVVILCTINLGAQSSTPVTAQLSRALSKALEWAKCTCTPVHIVRAVFSAQASMAVAVIVAAAMYWHLLTVPGAVEAQRAAAIDCLFGLPWGIAWAIRATRMPAPEKGGVL